MCQLASYEQLLQDWNAGGHDAGSTPPELFITNRLLRGSERLADKMHMQ
jgi:hypothetical protein